VAALGAEPFLAAKVRSVPDPTSSDVELDALVMNLKDIAKRVIKLMPELPKEAGALVDSVSEPGPLADLITGVKSEITTLPCVNHRSPNWELEPFRYLGVHYVQRAYWQIDQKAERSGVPPSGKTLAERLTRH